jgi:hypothetical protein
MTLTLIVCGAACSGRPEMPDSRHVGDIPVATTARVPQSESETVVGAQLSVTPAVAVEAGNPSSTIPLAQRIARDLREGNDIVITSYVALWYRHSREPAKNLYWGALYGHEAMFRPERRSEIEDRLPFLELKRYEVLVEKKRDSDPLAIEVLTASIPREGEGAGPASRLVVVNLAYRDMEQAALDMGNHLKTGSMPEGLVDEPEIRQLLDASYLIGYWGHNIYHGGSRVDCLHTVPSTREDGPRGVFMVGCQTARWYPQKFRSPGIEPLLFATTNMAPEGYVGLALYDGIARNLSKSEVRENVAEAYRVYQRLTRRPGSLFVNEWPQIERYMADVPAGDCAR